MKNFFCWKLCVIDNPRSKTGNSRGFVCQILNRQVMHEYILCFCYMASTREGCARDSPINCSPVTLLMCPLSVGESVVVSVLCPSMSSPIQNSRKCECNLRPTCLADSPAGTVDVVTGSEKNMSHIRYKLRLHPVEHFRRHQWQNHSLFCTFPRHTSQWQPRNPSYLLEF
jgi:hypothetical protein